MKSWTALLVRQTTVTYAAKQRSCRSNYLIQLQYTDTGPGSDPKPSGTQQGSHWNTSLFITGLTVHRKRQPLEYQCVYHRYDCTPEKAATGIPVCLSQVWLYTGKGSHWNTSVFITGMTVHRKRQPLEYQDTSVFITGMTVHRKRQPLEYQDTSVFITGMTVHRKRQPLEYQDTSVFITGMTVHRKRQPLKYQDTSVFITGLTVHRKRRPLEYQDTSVFITGLTVHRTRQPLEYQCVYHRSDCTPEKAATGIPVCLSQVWLLHKVGVNPWVPCSRAEHFSIRPSR